jgi:23S rRNA pseudouridine1911/1915/1917 synthase
MNPGELPGTLSASINILLEDGPCLVVNKPAGILTQGPPAAEDTLVRRTKAFLKERMQKPGNVYLGIPHRLDRAVTGVVLFAKNSKAAARLAEQFRERQVRKLYWAITAAPPISPEGSFVDWIEKVPDLPQAQIVPELTPTAREASLRYRLLRDLGYGYLVEVELITGRFHQIRCQLAYHGCPILGDEMYGGKLDVDRSAEVGFHGERIALHARSLEFLHPVRYEPVVVVAPPPVDWGEIGK